MTASTRMVNTDDPGLERWTAACYQCEFAAHAGITGRYEDQKQEFHRATAVHVATTGHSVRVEKSKIVTLYLPTRFREQAEK